eukprot:TRINITY_DN5624_c0_g2_i8.p1 TRINITY_DN5624_c0_g2~~TRINITY_DN5624_c0_g2_i8.p1  ORF type:complete len:104 (+),score=1.70 TRINITY_DN5624_c0_g2_i8:40-351(+)
MFEIHLPSANLHIEVIPQYRFTHKDMRYTYRPLLPLRVVGPAYGCAVQPFPFSAASVCPPWCIPAANLLVCQISLLLPICLPYMFYLLKLFSPSWALAIGGSH